MECFIPQRRGFNSFPPALALATKGPDTYLISCGLDPASQMGLWPPTTDLSRQVSLVISPSLTIPPQGHC